VLNVRKPAGTGFDVHGHGVPVAFLDAVRRSRHQDVDVRLDSSGTYVMTFPGRSPLRPMSRRMVDFAERLAWLDGQGMGRQLVAPWLDVHGQELDPEPGKEWVRRLNDAMAEATAGSGGRLAAHATLHMAEPAGAASELERCHRELGMRGCMIPTHSPGRHLDDRAYDVLWETSEALRIPVILHPPTTGPGGHIPGMEGFGGLYGRLIDTTAVATRLLLAGIFDRFPDLRLVLVHGGGFLPYQTGRLAQEQAGGALGQQLEGPVADYVRRYFFDTVLMSAHALRLLLDQVGGERIVIGSDYPFTADAPPLTSALHEATADQAVRAAVCQANARLLFADEEDGTA
jgi:aminocarboxymuconate-semialdehyde decarboxylase